MHLTRQVGLILLLMAILSSPAGANGGAYMDSLSGSGTSGTILPLKGTGVSLEREWVELDVYYNYTQGRVRYELKNGPTAAKILFGFPSFIRARRSGGEEYGRSADYSLYRISVDGQRLPSKIQQGPQLNFRQALREYFPAIQHRGKRVFLFDRLFTQSGSWSDVQAFMQYRTSQLSFQPNQTRTLQIEFVQRNVRPHYYFADKRFSQRQHDVSYYVYLTHPARIWRGKIRQAEFRLRILEGPRLASGKRDVSRVLVHPAPHRHRGNSYQWTYRNWEPDRDIRVLMPYPYAKYHRACAKVTTSRDPCIRIEGQQAFRAWARAHGLLWGKHAFRGARERVGATKAVNTRRKKGLGPLAAVDGDPDTRWVSSGTKGPQTLVLELARPTCLTGITLVPDFGDTVAWASDVTEPSGPGVVSLGLDGDPAVQTVPVAMLKHSKTRPGGVLGGTPPFGPHWTRHLALRKARKVRQLTLSVLKTHRKDTHAAIFEVALHSDPKACRPPPPQPSVQVTAKKSGGSMGQAARAKASHQAASQGSSGCGCVSGGGAGSIPAILLPLLLLLARVRRRRR